MKKLKIKNWTSCIQDRNKWKLYVEKDKALKKLRCNFEVSHARCVLFNTNITMYELVRTQLYLNMVQGVVFTINYMFRPLYWPSSGLHYA